MQTASLVRQSLHCYLKAAVAFSDVRLRLSSHAVDVKDAFGVSQRGHKCTQLLGVRNGEGELQRGNVVFSPARTHGQNIQLGLAEDLGHLKQ